MANRRLATTVAKKLNDLDRKAYNELVKPKSNHAKIDRWEREQLQIIKDAAKKINLVIVGVADGTAVYWETNRTTKHVTFEWLYGGGDQYVDDWGRTVIVPVAQANRMLKNFRPERAL